MAKPNSGFLQENPRYEKIGDPDQTGYVIAQCPCCQGETYFWLSSWDRKRDDKWVQTLAMRPRDEEGIQPRRPRFERVR